MTCAVDIVGDVHGHHSLLTELLHKLGYRPSADSWRHPEGRRVIFIGDYLDRGPQPFEVVQLVCAMCEAGDALAILGNHDSNAIAFATRRLLGSNGTRSYEFRPADAHRHARDVIDGRSAPQDGWLRDHRERSSGNHESPEAPAKAYKNISGHEATLSGMSQTQYEDALGWLRRLPLWIELPNLRCVHAAWIPQSQSALKSWAECRHMKPLQLECASVRDAVDALIARISTDRGTPSDDQWGRMLELPGRFEAKAPDDPLFDVAVLKPDHSPPVALERLLKGVEIRLPEGFAFMDNSLEERHHIRARWFEAAAGRTYHGHMLASDAQVRQIRAALGDRTIDQPKPGIFPFHASEAYPSSAPPVFFGHYALQGSGVPASLSPLAPNVACVDVHGADHLLAYRFDGESTLDPRKFVAVQGTSLKAGKCAVGHGSDGASP